MDSLAILVKMKDNGSLGIKTNSKNSPGKESWASKETIDISLWESQLYQYLENIDKYEFTISESQRGMSI